MSNDVRKEIPPELAGSPLDALVRQLLQTSWGKARDWIASGKISVDGKVLREPRSVVSKGALALELRMNAPRREREGGACFPGLEVVHVDTQVVVVNKPSGMSTVPYDETEKGTLYERLCAQLKARRLEVVHRIDKETSGLVVFARTQEASRSLAQQFRFHTVHRRYLALAHGRVQAATYRTTLLKNRGDGLRGSARPGYRVAPGEGKDSVTHVRPLESLRGVTLIECKLETGRTHQIRIHLSEAGHPLLGDRIYSRDFLEAGGEVIEASRVMLHAAELGFKHPSSGAELRWELAPPEDFQRTRVGLASMR